MNSCILQAEVIEAPQLRYTQDNSQVADMVVQFPGLRADDPASQLKVVGWGNLAQELGDRCRPGDQVVLEGRLRINSVMRPDGMRDRQIEFTLSRLHHLGAGLGSNGAVATPMSTPVTAPAAAAAPVAASPSFQNSPASYSASPAAAPLADYSDSISDDDIPF